VVGFEVVTAVSTKMAVFWVVEVNFYQSTRRYNPEDSHLRRSEVVLKMACGWVWIRTAFSDGLE
jgi:hypothetical protein